MSAADVVVVGAGVNGLSTACHLARSGVRRVRVLERRHIAAGATGQSGAIVRTHYGNLAETRLAQISMGPRDWAGTVGGSCGWREVGLLVAVPAACREAAEANVGFQLSVGAAASVITPGDARRLDRSLLIGDDELVVYESQAGVADPVATAESFAAAARRAGARIDLGAEVLAIEVSSGRVTGVRTSEGVIIADVVVITAGARARSLIAPLGIDLPIFPAASRVCVLGWARPDPPRNLIFTDHVNNCWVRPYGAGLLIGAELGSQILANPDDHDETVPAEYVAACRDVLARRYPGMRHGIYRGGLAGLLMRSPDAHPVLGPLDGVEGLYTLAADSGTSFKTSPAIGLCLSELITTGRSPVDITAFRSTRFAEKQPWTDAGQYSQAAGTVSR